MNKNTFIDLVTARAEVHMNKEYAIIEEKLEILNAKKIDFKNKICESFALGHAGKNINLRKAETELSYNSIYTVSKYVTVWSIRIKNNDYVINYSLKKYENAAIESIEKHIKENKELARKIQPCSQVVTLKKLRQYCREFVGAVGHLNSVQIEKLATKTVKAFFNPLKECTL